MTRTQPLSAEQLRRRCDPEGFSFDTTDELDDLDEIIGQDRAVEAVQFGIGIRAKGYNMFALGPPGTGRHSIIRQYLEKRAAADRVPDDWCYVYNYDQSHQPRALRLPAGRGAPFAKEMDSLIEELRVIIPAAFESDDYRNRKQSIEGEFKERHEKAFGEVQKKAKEKGITPIRTPAGMALAPVRDGEVLKPEEFEKLPDEEKQVIQQDIEGLQKELQGILMQSPQWEREQREKMRELNREVVGFTVDHLLEELRAKYEDLPAVVSYLDGVQQDVVEKFEAFLKKEGGEQEKPPAMLARMGEAPELRRYRVNVIVDHADSEGAPVIYEDHPTLQNLMGRVEHLSQFGTLITDFNLIKPGALHRANGGYLILDARKLLLQPLVWEELKRALRAGEIRIESVGQLLSVISTVSLDPEPVPLDIKIILVGERMLYYMLSSLDPDFAELFKVAVDFEDSMDRNQDSNRLYARLIATQIRRCGLKAFDRGGVARVIEQCSRLAGDAEKVSTQMRVLVDLLREADHFAGENGQETVGADDVERAVRAQIRRSDRLRERIQEEIHRGTILIDTQGEQVGQLNGLSVLQLGGFAFGRPSRITARVRLGAGKVLDIEREVELGGPTHSKGVLILSGFLGARYVPDKPLSLSASLVFEQSYGGIDGDSASSAELYALLSALAEVPLKQSLAVTGSVNQHGQVQAIGGVNQKIEGFFDVCRRQGLTGEQGVLIPASNVKHLMLRADVVEACSRGAFHVYPVETIDEGLALLSGRAAGARNKRGLFPENSVNRLVEDRLLELAEQARRFGSAGKQGDKKE